MCVCISIQIFFYKENLVIPVGFTCTNTKAQCSSLVWRWTTLRHGIFKLVHWVKKQKRQMYTLTLLLERPDEEWEQHKGCCRDQGVRMPGRGVPGETAVRFPLSTGHGLGGIQASVLKVVPALCSQSPHINNSKDTVHRNHRPETEFQKQWEVQWVSAIPVALKGFGVWDLKRKQPVVKWLDTPGPRTPSGNPNPCCPAAWPNLLCSAPRGG